MTKIKPLRDFAMLDEDWYEDDVLHAVAEDTTPMVFSYWPMLIGRCRELSHHEDNPLGWIPLTVRRAAKLVSDVPAPGESLEGWTVLRHAMWNGLVDGELVAMEGEVEARFRVRLINFKKYQTPKGSATDRSRNSKARAGEKVSQGTSGEHQGTSGEHQGTHSDRDRDIEEKGSNEPSSASAEPSTDHARILFDLWVAETGRNPNQNRLTKNRRSLVRARLRDGYTPEQLADAIRGIAASPWHQGQNPNGTRYDTFDFIFRSGENIEKGIERRAPGLSVVPATGRPADPHSDEWRRQIAASLGPVPESGVSA